MKNDEEEDLRVSNGNIASLNQGIFHGGEKTKICKLRVGAKQIFVFEGAATP